MFKPEITYTNNRNETFILGDATGVFLDESDLFNYEWEPLESQGSIVRVTRELEKKKIKLLFLNDTDPSMINTFLDIVDYDTRTCQPGVLVVDGYQRHCLFTASEAEDYMWKPGLMYRETTCVMIDSDWIKPNVYTFFGNGESGEVGDLDFAFDYSHDYGMSNASTRIVNGNTSPSDFILRVYGQISNPVITIGDNIYRINTSIDLGCYVEINSAKKTIEKIMHYGNRVNIFDAASIGKRGSGEYIFEQIAPGLNNVTCPANNRVDIEVLEGRSEPKRTGGW